MNLELDFLPKENWGQRRISNPEKYEISTESKEAVRVALTLGMPLLVSGEPGTGKTQLAYYLAWALNKKFGDKFRAEPLVFNTKSSSVAPDLFYHFDNVRYFGEAQAEAASATANSPIEPPDKRRYIQYRALGMAILHTRNWENNEKLISPSQAELEKMKGATGQRSVVLIDEIDKAPRDFPNDLLHQLETYSFELPELEQTSPVCADNKLPPVVIITSNSEKQLPDAFLRRCVYHHIAIPKKEKERMEWLDKLLRHNLPKNVLPGGQADNFPGWHDAMAEFFKLRDRKDLQKMPSTAEALDWMHCLAAEGVRWESPLKEQSELVGRALGTLLKIAGDLDAVRSRWQQVPKSNAGTAAG